MIRGSTEIVVHAIRGDDDLPGGAIYKYGELYRVNLDTEKITKCPGGRLYLDDYRSNMVISGNIIYILGGNSYDDKALHNLFKGKKPVHTRASYIDIDDADAEWQTLFDFKSLYPLPPCVSFQGNLFVFGGNIRDKLLRYTFTESPGEELLCPTSKPLQNWRFLPHPPPPPTIDGYTRHSPNHVSNPVLVDSENNRILVHHPCISSLYAYYPDQRKWEFLFYIGKWHRLAFFFDGMILFHHHKPTYFFGYDLKTGTKLDTPIISADFPYNLLSSYFDDLIPLPGDPPGTFCLATYTPEYVVPCKTHLVFLKFRVVRNDSGQPHITFGSLHTPDLDCNACVTNYVPVVNYEDDVVSSNKGNVATSSKKKDNVVVSSKKDNVAASSKKKDNVVASSKKVNVVPSKKDTDVSARTSSLAESWKSGAGIPFGEF